MAHGLDLRFRDSFIAKQEIPHTNGEEKNTQILYFSMLQVMRGQCIAKIWMIEHKYRSLYVQNLVNSAILRSKYMYI